MENWLNPTIGHMPLDNVKNLSLKNLGIKMIEGGLGESAIRSYTNVVKMVVASAVNEEGEALYPRKWNHSFIDLPRTRNPKQPSFAGAVVTRIVADAKKEKYRLLFALCGGTGLRFGEALGIQDISPDCSTIKIVQKARRSQLHNFLKTESGSREVDLCPALAAIAEGIPGQQAENAKARPIVSIQVGQASSTVQYSAAYIASDSRKLQRAEVSLSCLPAFPRYPSKRKNGVPEDLIHFWAGHAGNSVTDDYSKLKDDLVFRKEVAIRVGLGFELPSKKTEVGPNGPKTEAKPISEMAACV